MIEQFHRPSTVREALALKRRHQGRAAFLAGGTYLNSSACAACPERRGRHADSASDRDERRRGALQVGPPCASDCALRQAHVISLAGLGLDRIERAGATVAIGALCTLQRLIDDRRVPAGLRAAAAQVASRNVREMATLGGHVAANPPYSDLVPMLVALDARLRLSSAGKARTVRVAEYAAKPVAGLVTAIVVPAPQPGRAVACRNFRASANALSVVSAAVSLTVARGGARRPIVALGGVTGHVVRLAAVEAALAVGPPPALDELQALASRSVRPVADLSGSAEYRRYQAGAVVALTVRDALAGKGARS